MPRRILIATPFRFVMTPHYLETWDRIMTIPPTEFQIDRKLYVNTYVNFARNEIAYEAMAGGYDDVIQLDEDNAPTANDVRRILSYDEDIVGGAYCKKVPGYPPKWTFIPEDGAEPDARGLLKCNGIATGFLRTRVSAIRKLYDAYPDRMFYTPADGNTPMRKLCELFPMGVIDGGSAEARLADIKDALDKMIIADALSVKALGELHSKIRCFAFARRPPGNLLGEDYFFGKLARAAGLTVWADLAGPPISHLGMISFPITPDKVGWDAAKGIAIPETHPI